MVKARALSRSAPCDTSVSTGRSPGVTRASFRTRGHRDHANGRNSGTTASAAFECDEQIVTGSYFDRGVIFLWEIRGILYSLIYKFKSSAMAG